MVRRPQGSLESDVLAIMWANDDAMTTAEVLEAHDTDLAYTTVMPLRTRPLRQGLVARQRRGRAYAYRPTVTEAELRASKMSDALTAAKDRDAVLGRFVDTLSTSEAAALRGILDLLEPGRA